MKEEDPRSALGDLVDQLDDGQGGSELTPYAYNQASNGDPNLIVWQLELDNILERIEHLLKGDILKEEKDGSVVYTAPMKEIVAKIIQDEEGTKFTIDITTFNILSIVGKDNKEIEVVSTSSYIQGQALLESDSCKLISYKKVEVVDRDLIVLNNYGVQL